MRYLAQFSIFLREPYTCTFWNCLSHMGPHKTGTTSIQNTLRQRKMFKSMDEDGWDVSIVRGPKAANTIRCIMMSVSGCRTCKEGLWCEALNATVQNGAARGKNLLMSDEAMAHLDYASNRRWKELSLLLKEHYHVHAILVHRWYFEWLPSFYHEMFKAEGPYEPRGLQRWPFKWGVRMPPFTECWDRVLDNTLTKAWSASPTDSKWDNKTGILIHNVLNIKSCSEAQSIPVTVMNYHSGDAMETFLFGITTRHTPLKHVRKLKS